MSHAVRLPAALALLLLLVLPVSLFADDGATSEDVLVEVTVDDAGEAPAGVRAMDLLVTVERVVAGNVPGTSLIVRVPDGGPAPGLAPGERARLALAPGEDGSFRILRVEREGRAGDGGVAGREAPVSVAIAPSFAPAVRTGEAVAFQAVFTGPARSARWETEAGAFAFSEAACAADTFCAHHVFTRPGTYQVKVTATGARGQAAEAVRTVVVEGDEARLRGRESLLQSVLSTPLGAAGRLQSDLWLHNAGAGPVLVRATFVPRGLAEHGSQAVREVTISPGTSVFLPDVLGGLFGKQGEQGSLSLHYLLPAGPADAAPLVFAYSRSALEPAAADAAGFGQLIPEEPEATWSAAERIVPGILEGNGFVGTLAAVNLEGVGGQVTVSLEDAAGDPVGPPAVLTLAPRALRTHPLSRLFPGVVGRRGPFTARFASNGIRFTASSTLLEIESEDQVFLPAAPVGPGSAGEVVEGDLYVPRVVRGRGQFDTFQTSRLAAFNPSGEGRLLTLEFWERGQDNSDPRTAYRFLEPGRSLIVDDVLRDLFGVDEGTGALRVNWSGAAGPAPRLVSTIFTGTAGGHGKRFGALVDAIGPADAIRRRGVDFGAGQTTDSRSSFGAVNLASTGTTLRLTLRDAAGQVLAGAQVGLEPRQHLERTMAGLFPGIGNGQSWAVETEVVSGGPVLTYLARIDAGGDLFYVPGHSK